MKKKWIMEATIVIEINSGLDDKQKRYNTINIAKWVSYYHCSLLYENVN